METKRRRKGLQAVQGAQKSAANGRPKSPIKERYTNVGMKLDFQSIVLCLLAGTSIFQIFGPYIFALCVCFSMIYFLVTLMRHREDLLCKLQVRFGRFVEGTRQVIWEIFEISSKRSMLEIFFNIPESVSHFIRALTVPKALVITGTIVAALVTASVAHQIFSELEGGGKKYQLLRKSVDVPSEWTEPFRAIDTARLKYTFDSIEAQESKIPVALRSRQAIALNLDQYAVSRGFYNLNQWSRKDAPILEVNKDNFLEKIDQFEELISEKSGNSEFLDTMNSLGISLSPKTLFNSKYEDSIQKAAEKVYQSESGPSSLNELSIEEYSELVGTVGCRSLANGLKKVQSFKAHSPNRITLTDNYFLAYLLANSGNCKGFDDLSFGLAVVDQGGKYMSFKRSGTDSFQVDIDPVLADFLIEHSCTKSEYDAAKYIVGVIQFHKLSFDAAAHCFNQMSTNGDALIESLKINMLARVAFWKNRFLYGDFDPVENPKIDGTRSSKAFRASSFEPMEAAPYSIKEGVAVNPPAAAARKEDSPEVSPADFQAAISDDSPSNEQEVSFNSASAKMNQTKDTQTTVMPMQQSKVKDSNFEVRLLDPTIIRRARTSSLETQRQNAKLMASLHLYLKQLNEMGQISSEFIEEHIKELEFLDVSQ